MPTGLQSRSQYLVLAQFCQDAITALTNHVDGSAKFSNDTREILERTLDALRSLQQRDAYRFGQRPASALGSYEQLRILGQVLRTPEQLEDALALTTGLLEGDEPPDPEKVRDAIRLFTKLQGKALWNFEQPTPIAAPDLGELCRAFKTA